MEEYGEKGVHQRRGVGTVGLTLFQRIALYWTCALFSAFIVCLIVFAAVCLPNLVQFIDRAEDLIEPENLRSLTHSALADPRTIRASALKVFPPEQIEKRVLAISNNIGAGMAGNLHQLLGAFDDDEEERPATEAPWSHSYDPALTQRKRGNAPLAQPAVTETGSLSASVILHTKDSVVLNDEETTMICDAIQTRKAAHALLKQKLGCT